MQPKTGGDLPKPIDDWVNKADRFFNWAGESLLDGIEGGGYGFGGFQPGYWSDGAYGFTTVKPGTDVHYLHVCTPPNAPRLVIPDGGYQVTSAIDLKSGKPLEFSQGAGSLIITPPPGTWDALIAGTLWDFVIKLQAAPPQTVVPHAMMSARAEHEEDGHPAGSAVDADYYTYFSSGPGVAMPQSLAVDLGKSYAIKYVKINTWEDSPCLPTSFGLRVGGANQ